MYGIIKTLLKNIYIKIYPEHSIVTKYCVFYFNNKVRHFLGLVLLLLLVQLSQRVAPPC